MRHFQPNTIQGSEVEKTLHLSFIEVIRKSTFNELQIKKITSWSTLFFQKLCCFSKLQLKSTIFDPPLKFITFLGVEG